MGLSSLRERAKWSDAVPRIPTLKRDTPRLWMIVVTPEHYRRLALSLPEAVEGSHMEHPDFRVGGRIFATIWKGNGVLMLRPDQQSALVTSQPEIFSPAKGGWGKRGSTVVHLEAADESSVRQGLFTAWRNKASKGVSRPENA